MDEDGSTLVEILMSMALLAIIAVSVFSLFSTGQLSAQLAQEMEQAAFLGQQQLESIKGDLACSGESSVGALEPIDLVNFPGFLWEARSREVVPGLRRVEVIVSWSHAGANRDIRLVTYMLVPPDRR